MSARQYLVSLDNDNKVVSDEELLQLQEHTGDRYSHKAVGQVVHEWEQICEKY